MSDSEDVEMSSTTGDMVPVETVVDADSDNAVVSAAAATSLPNQPRTTQDKDYEKRYIEIDRRAQVVAEAKKAAADGNSLPPISERSIPSREDYNFVLLNKTHIGLNPHGRAAGVRILGFFKTRQDAVVHVQKNLARCGLTADELGDIHIAPRMKWILIPKTKERDQNQEYTIGKIDELTELHRREREAANADFERHKTDKSVGSTNLTLEKQRERQQAMAKKKHKVSARLAAVSQAVDKMNKLVEDDPSKSVASISRSVEIRRQSHAVIGIMKDFTTDVMKAKDVPEPAVLFIDCFDTVPEAQAYIKDVLSRYIRLVHMDIVDLYEWVYPETMDPEKLESTAEMWRNDEQNRIMRNHKDEKSKIDKYEDEVVKPILEVPAQQSRPVDAAPAEVSDVSIEPGQSLLPPS